MPGLQILLEANKYPEVANITSGKSVTLTITGTATRTQGGVVVEVSKLFLNKSKKRMNPTEVMLNVIDERTREILATQPHGEIT